MPAAACINMTGSVCINVKACSGWICSGHWTHSCTTIHTPRSPSPPLSKSRRRASPATTAPLLMMYDFERSKDERSSHGMILSFFGDGLLSQRNLLYDDTRKVGVEKAGHGYQTSTWARIHNKPLLIQCNTNISDRCNVYSTQIQPDRSARKTRSIYNTSYCIYNISIYMVQDMTDVFHTLRIMTL